MDDHHRRRRHNEALMHPTSDPRYVQPSQDASQQGQQPQPQPQQQQRRSYAGAGASNDRFRPAPLTTSPAAAAAAARGMGATAATYSSYYQSTAPGAFPAAMPQGTIGYAQSAADYTQDARQVQGYAGAYNATSMMYNVQQADGQAPVYDSSQHYPSRQPAAMEMLAATNVAAPYFASDPANAATTGAALQPRTASSTTSPAIYQRTPAVQGYPVEEGLATQTAAASSAANVAMDVQAYSTAGGLEEAYGVYQAELRDIFQNIRDGDLAEAGTSLLRISDWLLSHVQDLGERPPPSQTPTHHPMPETRRN